MTPEQKTTLERELRAHVAQCQNKAEVHFLHGACKGADEDAALIAKSIGLPAIVAYPGHSMFGDTSNQSKAALEASTDCTRVSQRYRVRNTQIVRDCQVLYATPPCKPLPCKGGTRMTHDIAVSQGLPIGIIWPDGSIN